MTPIPYEVVAKYIRKYLLNNPSWGIILGSGWNIGDSSFSVEHKIPYSRLFHFSSPTIPGHKGEFIAGKLGGIPVIILSGRTHLYEGYSAEDIVYPVRILARLGIKKLIITNAAGAINQNFQVGDIMLITDQINFQFKSLIQASPLGRLNIFDPALLKLTESIAEKLQLKLRKGVYIGVTGPNYETAAEIRMFRKIGADAVGMSTVMETVTAVNCGMKVLGISYLVNQATGLSTISLEHEQVLNIMEKAKNQLNTLLKNVVVEASLYEKSGTAQSRERSD